MLAHAFHRWERRLASADNNRIVRPFEWGAEWIDELASFGGEPRERFGAWSEQAVRNSDRFFDQPQCRDYRLDGQDLTFPSAVVTPHPDNNIVRARYFPSQSEKGQKRAVVVLPQWNADAGGHVGLCQLLNMFGITALRLTLPYHDERMPPELERADYIVSANIGRTAQVCRQAVLDARRAIAWLSMQGYESIGILGTSLGSCLAMLTATHEPLVRAAALNHISPYFADVVWEGLSTSHVRRGLEGSITLDELRNVWMPISPFPHLDRIRGKAVLLVYARYDLTFPVSLSKLLIGEFRRRGIDHQLTILPCGHYSTGKGPFKWMDGLALCRFLSKSL